MQIFVLKAAYPLYLYFFTHNTNNVTTVRNLQVESDTIVQ
jgi:hypothetical protein